MTIQIDDAYVNDIAPNADAVKNGRALLAKGKYFELGRSEAGDLIFGKCQGSGKVPYACSSDFSVLETPVHRCNCPSRQFPCKHCVGLLLAYAKSPGEFVALPIPEDLQSKRAKVAARTEKKKETVTQPKKVNKTALSKKLQAQLEGLEHLDSLLEHVLTLGLGNISAKELHEIEGQAKRLGDMYLPGAQMALRAFTILFRSSVRPKSEENPDRERILSEAVDRLAVLRAISKEGKAYLLKRLEDPDLKPDTESRIAEWLGHAWQLSELREAGLVISNAELIQLAFHTYSDDARTEYVDVGTWFELTTAKVYSTYNFRPYRAAKHIKEEDSYFKIAQVAELFVYPGEFNQRVRWEGKNVREPEPKDYQEVRRSSAADFGLLIKQMKNLLKNPLSDKQSVCLLRYAKIGKIDGKYVIEDEKGFRLVLSEQGLDEEPASLELLPMLKSDLYRDHTLVGRIHQDLDTLQLTVKPISIVSPTNIVRLTF